MVVFFVAAQRARASEGVAAPMGRAMTSPIVAVADVWVMHVVVVAALQPMVWLANCWFLATGAAWLHVMLLLQLKLGVVAVLAPRL